MFSSGPTVTAMNIHPKPVGTIDELRAANMDVCLIGSCSPPNKPHFSGCNDYERCIFRFNRNGGFRDHGPRNVGYYHQTHEGRSVENECSCHFFMSRMWERMRAGERDRQDGLQGEIIQIIAIEPGLNHKLSGEVIHRQMTVNLNEGITTLPAKWEKKTFTAPVSKFPRLADRVTVSYDTTLEDRRRLRELADAEVAAPVHRVGSTKEDPVMDVASVVESVVAGAVPDKAPVAVPVERKGKP